MILASDVSGTTTHTYIALFFLHFQPTVSCIFTISYLRNQYDNNIFQGDCLDSTSNSLKNQKLTFDFLFYISKSISDLSVCTLYIYIKTCYFGNTTTEHSLEVVVKLLQRKSKMINRREILDPVLAVYLLRYMLQNNISLNYSYLLILNSKQGRNQRLCSNGEFKINWNQASIFRQHTSE